MGWVRRGGGGEVRGEVDKEFGVGEEERRTQHCVVVLRREEEEG